MLRKPVNRTEWVGHDISTQVNAFYHPSENSINLPAGILQGTFFDGDRPEYMNYGAIGSVIGHEFSHCFNPPGNNFDEHENSETLKKSAQIAECIINQYSNFTVEFAGVNVDGNKTLVENVADNGGIKTAYLAYKEYVKRNDPESKLPNLKYTPEQMFWISAANTHCVKLDPHKEEIMIKVDYHCPNRFRVIGSFANSQEFPDDFNCPIGSHMNSVHKCSVL